VKTRKSRTVAKVFLWLAILSVFMVLSEAACYALLQDWIPFDFDIKLPFTLKYEYILSTLGVALILWVITLWLFVLSHERKACDESFDETEEEQLLDACVSDSYTIDRYAYLQAPARKKENPSEEKWKSAAKIVLPIVGICAVGITLAVLMKKHRKKN